LVNAKGFNYGRQWIFGLLPQPVAAAEKLFGSRNGEGGLSIAI
jgi:hypothetical protein